MKSEMEQTAKLPLTPGEVVAGKYRIEGVLGAGGMATVFSAWHEELEQRVALKVLHGQLGADPTTVKRFMREARNVARIQSEHVARIMDVGRHTDGQAFIVMEHLEGNDLAAALKARGPMTIPDVVDYVVQACDVLAVAHSMGIVHRDLKPGNLFLTRRIDGSTCVKVLDFGIAKASGDSAGVGELTMTTSLVGSPKYMAPEQMANARDVDARTDIYSLGVIAYRLLSAQLPFRGDNLVELAMNVAGKKPLPLRTHRPDVPPELEAIIMRCIEREREARYDDVGQLARALAPFGSPALEPLVRRILRITEASRPLVDLDLSSSGELPVASPQNDGPTLSSTLAAPMTSVSATMPPPKQQRSRAPLWAGLVVLLGASVGVGAFLFTHRAHHVEPVAAASSTPSTPVALTSTPSTTAAPSASVVEPEPSKPVAEPPKASAAPSATTVFVPVTAGSFVKPKASAAPSASQKKDVWGWGE